MELQKPLQEQGLNAAKLYLWVKGLEGKVNNLLREVDLIKNNFITKNNELQKEVKILNEEIVEFKHQQNKTEQKIDLIIKELKQTAGNDEVMFIKKYLDLWSPLNFVTQRDLERAIENKVSQCKSKKISKS